MSGVPMDATIRRSARRMPVHSGLQKSKGKEIALPANFNI
jgi:hypothetical protein